MPDRQVSISIGDNRWSKNWRQSTITVSELYRKLSRPVIGVETLAEYLKMPKKQQDALKDVGGFVGGTLRDPHRKAVNVTGRDLITLDFDNIPGWQSDMVAARVEALNCNYCIYSTRKHSPAKPRLRIIIPLDRTVTPDEYEPIARRLAQQIGIEMADKTTFDVSRLMYWPSCCSDTEYYFKYRDAQFISADMVLGTYPDWHDVAAWPQVPGAISHKSLAVKQGDPLEKPGIVGAFCRTYTIDQAMTAFLPGVYEPVEGMSDRYTFLGGSTTGGAIVYEDKFLYSHHATDPCGERLVNAFDMVRLHMFGDLDNDADPGTPASRMPSFIQMCGFAEQDRNCRSTLNRERQAAAAADFSGVTPDTTSGTDADWRDALEYKLGSDVLKNTINNYYVVLENDPAIKDKFSYNGFAERKELFGTVPWDGRTERRMWTDADTNGLYWFIETSYGQVGRGNVDSALSMYMAQHQFNEVQDYIHDLVWDGKKRLDTLFIDYLGAEDTEYTRTVTRKMFMAGIARAMHPGTKFDNMLILVGPQGIGKSTILSKMARGWFNDSICSFEGKDAAELLQGIWIVEVSELDAFRKSETSRIKQFLSLNSDIFRPAYARNAEERKRRCIFFGTTNTIEFLRDPTGERRFWPVDTGITAAKRDVFEDLTEEEVTQIWAEARAHWIAGEPLHLTPEMEKAAREKQIEHKETSVREGTIREFVARQIPDDWQKYTIDKRRLFWGTVESGAVSANVKLVDRDRISAAEIWCEAFGGDIKMMRASDAREINAVLDSLPDWIKSRSTFRCGPYGTQRGYIRREKM
jgi:predicted P-loop ATPase